MEHLPDLLYIDQIRKRLWTGREIGQAAVMIGSGFSRNAEPVLQSAPPFPLWEGLAQRMYEELNPAVEDDKNIQTSTQDVLKLASEYEVVFERAALNELIIRTIPNTDYTPGHLHRLLLSLPWSDVFTTNYDTLLERTLPSIHDRRYDVILTSSDLPGSMKPRIIKLHGSLPSRRFIVTQEDFRTYPIDFAPFVNTVQQAIMENALCLIGFSGDDPNFLYWAGWVRDNLGKATPPIYLCSLTEVSAAQRRVLESRNIFPVDLSTVIPRTQIPDTGLRYSKTVEWLFLTLMAGEQPRRHRWPKISRSTPWVPSYGLPVIAASKRPDIELGNVAPDGGARELTVEELRDVYLRWKAQRLSYPNWEILPNDNRETLWRYTGSWIGPVLNALSKLPIPENLLLLYELNWRLEKSLVPICDQWCEKYVSVVNAFDPFPVLSRRQNAIVRPGMVGYEHFDWQTISNVWIELFFALVREARESVDETRFSLLIEELREPAKQKPDWQARWYYEQSLFWLFTINHVKARAVVDEWASLSGAPFWQVKRAAVLAEIGEIQEAERIAEEALSSIRSQLRPYPNDFRVMSQEGWTMVLLKSLKDNRFGEAKEATAAHYRDRWDQLARYYCNPWSDLENSELIITALDPAPLPALSKTRGFHPGSSVVSTRMIFGSDPITVRHSLAFLRVFEEAALPFRSNAVSFFSKAVVNAAKCIATSAPEWSLSAMLRTSAEDEIKGWFDYLQVATLPRNKIDYLYNLFLTSFTQAAQHLQMPRPSIFGDTSQRQAQLYAALLSRLCIRLLPEQLEQMFELARTAYIEPIFRQTLWYHEIVSAFFEGVLESFSYDQIVKRIPHLLSLPIPSETGFEVAEPQRWPEPFRD